jgi:hypothetical protein
MDNCGDQSTGNRNGQTDKILFVGLDEAFGENSRTRSLNIKASKTKATAHQVHEGKKPRQTVQATSLLKSGTVSPHIGQYRGGETKGHNVGHGIQLDAYLGRRFGHARDAPIKHVKEKGPTNRLGSVVEVARGQQQITRCTCPNKLKSPYAGHHGVEAHPDIGGGENGGD